MKKKKKYEILKTRVTGQNFHSQWPFTSYDECSGRPVLYYCFSLSLFLSSSLVLSQPFCEFCIILHEASVESSSLSHKSQLALFLSQRFCFWVFGLHLWLRGSLFWRWLSRRFFILVFWLIAFWARMKKKWCELCFAWEENYFLRFRTSLFFSTFEHKNDYEKRKRERRPEQNTHLRFFVILKREKKIV